MQSNNKKSSATMMLLAATCAGMLCPVAALGVVTADETQAPYSPDFSNISASPTQLAPSTNEIVGKITFNTDLYDIVLFEGQTPFTNIQTFYQVSGTANSGIINLYDPSNNIAVGGAFLPNNSSGSFFATVPASGSLRAEINFSSAAADEFMNYTITLPSVPEPSSTSLAMVALGAMVAKRRVKK